MNITSENFDAEVINSDKPVVVDFNATWCPPCQALHPILEELANESDNYKVVFIDVDEDPILATEYRVSSIPCLVFFKNGEEYDRRVGLLPKKRIKKILEA